MTTEMTTKPTPGQKIILTLQWWRVPLMTAFVLFGVYLIKSASMWLWIGMGVTFVGEIFQLWAASQLRKDKVLCTSGPYAHVRNPMYCGRFLVLLGFMIMIQQAWWTKTSLFHLPMLVIGYYIIFALYVRPRVGREEARLRGIFGEEYINYCKEVPRFFPRLRPYSKTSGQKWAWAKIVANHEYLNMVAVIIVFAIIVARIMFGGKLGL
jgi:protein-S-isoprenylcysteine O-methyltransferase Ste14